MLREDIVVADKPTKMSTKSVLKLPNRVSAKASSNEAVVQVLDIPADITPATPVEVEVTKAGKVTKSRKLSPKKPPEAQLPRFDRTTDWNAAHWINDPPLLAKVRAAMIPETISYPEALPDIGRATLFRFEAGQRLISEVAPLEAGMTYALATRRDGTFLLFRET